MGHAILFPQGYSLYFIPTIPISGFAGVEVLRLGSRVGFLGLGCVVDRVWACGVVNCGLFGVGAIHINIDKKKPGNKS